MLLEMTAKLFSRKAKNSTILDIGLILATLGYWGYIGIMENKMETTIVYIDH